MGFGDELMKLADISGVRSRSAGAFADMDREIGNIRKQAPFRPQAPAMPKPQAPTPTMPKSKPDTSGADDILGMVKAPKLSVQQKKRQASETFGARRTINPYLSGKGEGKKYTRSEMGLKANRRAKKPMAPPKTVSGSSHTGAGTGLFHPSAIRGRTEGVKAKPVPRAHQTLLSDKPSTAVATKPKVPAAGSLSKKSKVPTAGSLLRKPTQAHPQGHLMRGPDKAPTGLTSSQSAIANAVAKSKAMAERKLRESDMRNIPKRSI